MNRNVWIGIDVGSITCKVVVLDADERVLAATYRRTRGRVVEAVKDGLDAVADRLAGRVVAGCGTTGSARKLVGALVGADVVKNEITAHARACLSLYPDTRTILEIGGEDSKIIVLRDGVPVDFAMNTVCAAGTGAFLDQLAARLGAPVERLGDLAAASTRDVAIAGRCTVFAESDIIFKQQTGHRIEDIVAGACRSLVRNYLNDVGKGKAIEPPVLFLGGVAANRGIEAAFAEALGVPVTVPEHHHVMGAFGAALVAKELDLPASRMRDPDRIRSSDFRAETFTCPHCPNACEIVRFVESGSPVATLGGRCDRWSAAGAPETVHRAASVST
jgi:predicted CoA-substrate-specific enzyme activase